MGSKGTSSQTSSYTANPAIQNAGYQALGMAQNAANSPFQLPEAPVAGFNQDQQQAFQQYRNLQGMAQPYYNQAQSLFSQSASPISGSQINNYMNPYADYVLGNLKETQGQQMNDLTGRLTQAAGGVGADRIAVGQGELARQQNLATGQTLSGLYGSALSAAQQDAQRQQSAAYGIGNLGGAAQNAALQGAGALYGAGATQQGLNQQQLNSQYQNQLARIAFPYQNAQYLAGITGGLAGALGGNNSQTSTPAQPSIYSQILGLGTGAIGALGTTGAFGNSGWLAGSSPSYGGGNFFSGDAYGGSQSNPLPGLSAADYGYADGGRTEPDWMNVNPTIPHIDIKPMPVQQPQMSKPSGGGDSGGGFGDVLKTAASIIPFFLARGGTVPYPRFADGGETDGLDFEDRFNPAAVNPLKHRDNVSFAERFSPAESAPLLARAATPFADRFSPAQDNPLQAYEPGVINPTEPYRLDPAATDKWRTDVASDPTNPMNTGKPPLVAKDDEEMSPYNARAAQETGANNMKAMQGATYEVPYPKATKDESTEFARNPWTALMNAGFAIAGGTSPFAGVNIGKGLQEGVKTLEKQRTEAREEESVNQRAKQLAQQAQQHLDQYTKMTPYQAAQVENQRANIKMAQDKLEMSGWQKGAENILTGDTTYFNPRTQESGILSRDGTWTPKGKGAAPAEPVAPPPGAAPGAAPAPGAPPAAGAAPTAPPIQATPPAPPPVVAPKNAPYGVPDLATNLEPSPANIPFIGKNSPMAGAAKKDLDTTITQQNKAAQLLPSMKQDLAAMRSSMDILTKDADKDSFLSQLALQPGASGATFSKRLELAKEANLAKQAAGLPPAFDPAKIAAAENINKIQARMGMIFGSQISPREAFAGQKIGIESSPGLTNSVQGFKRLMAGFEAATENTTDEMKFFQDYLKKNGTSLGWRQDFEAKNPPERYLVKALISQLPKVNQDNLKSDVEALRKDPSQRNIDLFNKHYEGTAGYFLSGRM